MKQKPLGQFVSTISMNHTTSKLQLQTVNANTDPLAPRSRFTNFAPSPINFQDKRYPTAEHRESSTSSNKVIIIDVFTVFQARKFLDKQPHLAERIRQLPTARAALEEASRLHRLQRRDWFDVNIGVMEEILEEKFRQHRHLRHCLLDTGNRDLIEASPVRTLLDIVAGSHRDHFTGRFVLGHWTRWKRKK